MAQYSIPDIYQYTDYRLYLRDWFEQMKPQAPQMSYRYLARKTGVDAGYLARVFQGDKHLSEEALVAFCELIGFGVKQKRYMQEMLRFNKAKRDSDIRDRFEKLSQLRESSARVLNPQEYRYWMHWYVPAIRLTLLNEDFKGDFIALSKRITPNITPRQAQEAVELLITLGLVQLRADGVYEVLDSHLSTGDVWTSAAIREFQANTLDLARESLRIHPPELREIATLTMAIPREEIPTLQEMMREFRSKVAKWALGLQDSNCVMQFDIATFPMSLPEGTLENTEARRPPEKRKKS